MNAMSTVSLTIEDEAAECVTQLGLQREMEQMLEQARRLFPGLRRLRVMLEAPYDTGPDPAVVIEAYVSFANLVERRRLMDQYRRWKLETFSPDVLRYFTLLDWEPTDDAG